MLDNNEEANKIKDASLVEDLIEDMNNLDLKSTLGQRQFYNDYSEATNLVFENPEILNANPEILKNLIKLSLQMEDPLLPLNNIYDSIKSKIEPDIWIELFSDENFFEKLSDILSKDEYIKNLNMYIYWDFLYLVDYAIKRIENEENNVEYESNDYNKKTKDFIKNIFGIYGYKIAKENVGKSIALMLLARFDEVKHIISENEITRNRVDDICECIIKEFVNKDETFPNYVYEYIGNRIKDKGYNLNCLLFLLSNHSVEFIENNKSNPRYKNLIECYTSVTEGENIEIKDIDKEKDIFKLDRRYKGAL